MPARHTLRRQYIDGLGGGNGGSAVLRVPCPPPRPESGISSACPRVGSPGHRPTTRERGRSLCGGVSHNPLTATGLGFPMSRANWGSPCLLDGDRVHRRRRRRVPDLLAARAGSPGIDVDDEFPASQQSRFTNASPTGSPRRRRQRRLGGPVVRSSSEPRGVCGYPGLHANPRGAPRAYIPDTGCGRCTALAQCSHARAVTRVAAHPHSRGRIHASRTSV